MADVAKLSHDIDSLLEQYLQLLDQYTTLREQLNVAQSSINQHLARANFTADRGVRYGPELYDARIRASRLCRITPTTSSPEHDTAGACTLSTFSSSDGIPSMQEELKPKAKGEVDGTEKADEKAAFDEFINLSLGKQDTETEGSKEDSKTTQDPTPIPSPKPPQTNPLRMFGILTPPSLKLAQTVSIDTVSRLIPQIIELSMRMGELEIRIRRGRKFLAKAEKAEAKREDAEAITGKREVIAS